MPAGLQRNVDPTLTPTLSKWAGTFDEVFKVFGKGVDVFVESREKVRQRTTGITPTPAQTPAQPEGAMPTSTWLLIGAVVLLIILFATGGRKAIPVPA